MTTDKIIYDLLPDDMPNEQAKQLSRRISNALYSEGPQLAKEAIEYALHMRDLWSAEQFGTHTPPHMVNRIKEGLLIMERKLEAAGRALLEPTIEPDKEVSADEAADIKAKEFFEGVLNMDWMSKEEKQTIYDAAELYAQGRVRYASLSKKEVGEGKDLDVSGNNSLSVPCDAPLK
jgi:hypothetical protein